MSPAGVDPADFAAAVESLQGGNMLALAMVQHLYFALADHGIIPADRLAEAMDEMLLQFEQIAATPGHEMPGAVTGARRRLEAFLQAFREATGKSGASR